MCGIAGFCDFRARRSDGTLAAMVSSIAHRGPDADGEFTKQIGEAYVGLGHRRLSIIDLSEGGRQPMISDCGQYVIVFNGEIYNYQDVRNELLSKGVAFRTQSDTEVLLNSYRQYGHGFLDGLRGMFAFVILDLKLRKLVAFRDRIGVKPLYYYYADDLFLFGSELKALVNHPSFPKEISRGGLVDYFQFGYIGGDKTIYQNTWKLEKGHLLELSLDSRVLTRKSYWDISTFFHKPKLKADYHLIEEELIHRFREAFSLRLVSDVPVGVFLSGGYDSALVTAILSRELGHQLSTFTLAFEEEEYDESPYARRVAELLRTSHHSYRCSENDAVTLVDKIPFVFDEPFSDPSAIPTMLISREAARSVKVILSGDGGDENFCGYNRYLSYYRRLKSFPKLPLRKATQSIGKRVSGFVNKPQWVEYLTGDASAYLTRVNKHLSDSAVSEIFDYPAAPVRPSSGASCVEEMLLWDMNRYLPDDVLVKVDRSSMFFGLESREPLLDHKVMEYTAQIPFEYKLRGDVLKYPIKNIVHKYLPKEVMNRPKRGFSPPLKKWIDQTFHAEFHDIVNAESLKRHGLINADALTKMLSRMEPEYLKVRFMWSLFMFQKWYKTWIAS